MTSAIVMIDFTSISLAMRSLIFIYLSFEPILFQFGVSELAYHAVGGKPHTALKFSCPAFTVVAEVVAVEQTMRLGFCFAEIAIEVVSIP